jgi:hypothetical protein
MNPIEECAHISRLKGYYLQERRKLLKKKINQISSFQTGVCRIDIFKEVTGGEKGIKNSQSNQLYSCLQLAGTAVKIGGGGAD